MPHYYFDYWNGHIATPGKEGVESADDQAEWTAPRRPARLPAGFIEPCNPTFSAKAPSGR